MLQLMEKGGLGGPGAAVSGAWGDPRALKSNHPQLCRARFSTDLCSSQWLHQPFLVYL